MSTTTEAKPRATFGTSRRDTPGVVDRARIMYAAFLAAAATFQSAPITMVAFLALIQAVETAQQNALSKGKGTASARNVKRDALWTAMQTLLIFVQSLADGLTAEGAVQVIQAAGLLVAKTTRSTKPILQAKLTTTPNVVHLEANATALKGMKTSKKVNFNWQWSQDAKSWVSVTSTPYARTDISGLTPMTTYWFRASATIGAVPGEWSPAVSLVVH